MGRRIEKLLFQVPVKVSMRRLLRHGTHLRQLEEKGLELEKEEQFLHEEDILN